MSQLITKAYSSPILFLALSVVTSLILLINVSFKIVIIQGLVFTVSSLLCPIIALLYLVGLRFCSIKEQRHVLNIALISLYVFCIGVYILVNLPAAEYMHDNQVYQIVFEDIPKKFFATTIAFALSFYIPHWLFYSKTPGDLSTPKQSICLFLFGGLCFFGVDFYLLFSSPHAHSFKQIFMDSSMITSLMLLLIAVVYMSWVLDDQGELLPSSPSQSSERYLSYYYLLCFAVVVVLICIACEYRIVALTKNTVLTASCIFFPITLIISTLIGERWGYQANLKLTLVLVASQFVFDGMLMGIVALPSPPFFNLNPFYDYIMPRRIPAATLSLFLAFSCNTVLLHFFKSGRWRITRWLRILIASISANSLLCVVDYSVLYGGIYPCEQIISLVANVWQYKLVVTILSLPMVTWLCSLHDKRHEAIGWSV